MAVSRIDVYDRAVTVVIIRNRQGEGGGRYPACLLIACGIPIAFNRIRMSHFPQSSAFFNLEPNISVPLSFITYQKNNIQRSLIPVNRQRRPV